MRKVTRDPNITPEVKAARRARMAALGQALRERALAADMAHAIATAVPMTPAEFESELERREAMWAEADAISAGAKSASD